MEAKTHPYQELFIFNLAQVDYLQNQMNKISHSFAVVVAPLKEPMLNKRHVSLLILIFFLLPVILAACSGGESDEITEPTPTFMPVTGTQIGDSEESSQSEESEDSSGEGESILSEVGPTRTPEATATPGPITSQVSRFTAKTGLDDITILGLSIEDWINIGLTIFIGLIGYLIGTWLVRGLATWVIGRTSSEFGNNLVESIGSSVRWLVVLVALQLATNRLIFLSADLKILLGDVYFIVGWVLLLRISWRSIDLGVQQATKRLSEKGRDKELAPVIILAEGTAKVLAVLVLIGILLAHFGFNLIAFVAALGVGGLAISLAVKDMLANAIGGLIILIDQPFRVGDRIEDMARKPLSMAIILAVLGFSALGIWGGNLGAPVLVAISASIIVILVVLDISRRIRNPLGRQRETN